MEYLLFTQKGKSWHQIPEPWSTKMNRRTWREEGSMRRPRWAGHMRLPPRINGKVPIKSLGFYFLCQHLYAVIIPGMLRCLYHPAKEQNLFQDRHSSRSPMQTPELTQGGAVASPHLSREPLKENRIYTQLLHSNLHPLPLKIRPPISEENCQCILPSE